MIVDGSNLVMGRLASRLAKAVIKGENVVVVNSEKIVVTGNKESIIENYELRTNAAVKSNPHYGPKYERVPSKMFRRTIKGMLPQKKTTKLAMLKRVAVYNGVPKKLEGQKFETFEEIKFNERNRSMTLKEIAELLGGKW